VAPVGQPPGSLVAAQQPQASAPAPVQPQTPAAEGHAAPGQEAHGEAEDHGNPWVDLIARLTNFAILAGTLVYLLRSPLAKHLADRHAQVRKDLVEAAKTRSAATAQFEDVDRRLRAMPGELEALRRRGAEEIAAEEARIDAAAEAERARLLEQTRREIDLQVRIAKRELMKEAATLAVGVASERIRRSITNEDQSRLVDRYLEQLRPGRG
jgi:F-type H+-transporting ATPase subunit b